MTTTQTIANDCLETLATVLRMAMKEGGPNAKLHCGDMLRVIEGYQSGEIRGGAPITGPLINGRSPS